jgi:peptide/nickel transport system substrate-binding protein
MNRKITRLLPLLIMLTLIIAACSPQTVEVTRVVENTIVETVEVEVAGETQTVEVTRVVSEEVVVEPTSAPIPQGGNVIESSFSDSSTLNPIIASDQASNDVITQMFLGLVALEPFTGRVIGQIAESWETSDDGLVYTFNLRDDILWSDGTQLTANDVAFTYDAINTDSVLSPRRSNFELVDSWEAIDDFTLELRLKSIDCTIISNLTTGILPAHAYDNDPENIAESDENTAPTIVSGPFTFVEWIPDDHITLAANPDFYLGKPNVDTWTRRVYADESAELAGFLAGETQVISRGVGPQFVSVIEGQIATGAPMNMSKFFDNGNVFVGLNLANPDNPQNGWDDLDGDGKWTEGEPALEQDPHPILSDLAVRQAIAYSVDYNGIINQVAFGEGTPTIANVWPSIEWAYNNDIPPYSQDLELAQSILEEAGWVDTDGDGVREKDGQTLSFGLMTNAGNETRENIGVLIKDVLDSIGFQIELEYIEFGTVVQNLLGQTYDAVIIGFGGGAPEPDDTSQFSYKNDEVGAGFNFVSYYNAQVEDNLAGGKGVAGCAEAERAPFYLENQELMHNDIPYIWLYTELENGVWSDQLQIN